VHADFANTEKERSIQLDNRISPLLDSGLRRIDDLKHVSRAAHKKSRP
jgi:hypothetical protein